MSACLALCLLASATGCVSSTYLSDRRQDACDVFTASVGNGGGMKLRAGPVQLGMLYAVDTGGLRGGMCHAGLPVGGDDSMARLDAAVLVAGIDNFHIPGVNPVSERHKNYTAVGVAGLMWLPPSANADPVSGVFPERLHYYTQIELVIGAWKTLRVACNPGELLDFLLGWFGADIFRDDSGERRSES